MIRKSTTVISLKVLLLFTILIFLFSDNTQAQIKSDTVSFLHISDIHYCNLNNYHPTFVKERLHYGNVNGSLVNFLNTVPKEMNVDFVVATGDITDYYEASSITGEMLDTQIEQFANLVNNTYISNVPLYMTLGNHDIASYNVINDSSYNSSQLNAVQARAAWVRNFNCFRNGTYYSKTVEVDSKNYRLIFLDNGYRPRKKGDSGNSFVIDRFQLDWLEGQLNMSEDDTEIIFMHMPLFEIPGKDIESSKKEYHLSSKELFAINHEIDITQYNSKFYNLLDERSSARLIISGHLHGSTVHNVKFSDNYSLTQVMTGAFARDSQNWRLIQLTDKNIIIYFPGEKQIQYTIPLNN